VLGFSFPFYRRRPSNILRRGTGDEAAESEIVMSRYFWILAIVAAIALGVGFFFARFLSEGTFAMPPKDPYVYPWQKQKDQPFGRSKSPPPFVDK
jgi:hypothetical protein